MKRKIIFLTAAREEFDDATLWYKRIRPDLGAEFKAAAKSALLAADQNPLQYPLVEGTVRRLRIRRYPYSVFYMLNRESIIVIAVIHDRRDPKLWKLRAGY